jgi:hypothetical protein
MIESIRKEPLSNEYSMNIFNGTSNFPFWYLVQLAAAQKL